MQWFLWALSLFCAVLLWSNSQLKQDIADLRLQVYEAQAKALSVAKAKETQIERATEQASTVLAAQVAKINQLYQKTTAQEPATHIVASHGNALHGAGSAASTKRMQCSPREDNSACISTAATSTSGTERTAQSRSLDASARATQVALERLRRCEQRALYEAKEYDLLAVHYNALLAIYEKAREVNNGYPKSEQREN